MAAAAAALGGLIGEGIVEKLVNMVSAYLRDQIRWDENITSVMSKLEVDLLTIKRALERYERLEINLDKNPELGKWIWKLRDAIEETEDILDEMEYNRLEHQILIRDAEVRKIAATSGIFKSMFRRVSTSMNKFMKIERDPTLEKLNTAVENLELVKQNLNAVNSVSAESPSFWDSYNPNISGDRSEFTVDMVVGREEEKEKVLQWLTGSGGDSQESLTISALTIWGMGGIGKTCLAQHVYNEKSLEGYFQVKMWVCVSGNQLSMVEIMKRAIESAASSPLIPKPNIMTNLQEKLKSLVKSKKFLLVLDDVWDYQRDQNQQQWENFIGLVSEHAERGSKILITSQIDSVAQVVLQGLPIKKDLFPLGCLEQAESLSLFYKHAFAGLNPDEHPNLKSVGKIITRKCGGLPLALKLIGRLLNKNIDHRYWVSVSEEDVLNLDTMQGIKIPLKFSYQCLPSHLQTGFRICSLFERDYQFKKDEMGALWMGLGIIEQSIGKHEDIVQEYLDILVGRSFFFYNNQSKSYAMHDLLHDLARHVSEGEGLRIKGDTSMELPRSLRYLFVDGFNSNFPETISSLTKLRHLYLQLPERDLHDGFRGMHLQFKSLRFLVINTRTMPDLCAVELLKHLRVFDMQVRILDKPLKPLNKLYQLLTLRCSEVVKPSEADDARRQIKFGGIENLGRLRFLDQHNLIFDKISNLAKLRYLDLPDSLFDQITELRYLTSLQKLKLHLRKDSKLKLCDLKNLNRLRYLIIIDEREKTSSEQAQEANLEDKPYLERLLLSLKWTNREPHLHKDVCNFLRPKKLSYIKDLEVTHYNGVEAPGWMTSDYLPCLTHLKLSQLNKLEHLPPLGKLPCLKVLSLQNFAGIKQSGTDFFASDVTEVFPSLEELRIENMENLEEWTRAENIRWFPRLNKLYIASCPQLKALPALPPSLKILNLKSVGLTSLPAWQDVNYHEVSPALHDLRIDSCEKLVRIESFLSRCSSLEQLWINQCLCDRAKAFSFYVGKVIDVEGER